MTPQNHVLFRQFPIDGQATLSIGKVPTPYHIYDGSAVFIGGTADYAEAQGLLAGEKVTPVQTLDGKALMGIWVCDFRDASLGPHTELQFSIFVANNTVRDIPTHPISLLAAMVTRPDVQMLCHGLWNNTPTVVAYNRELLSLNAKLAQSEIKRDGSELRFAFQDATLAMPVFAGGLRRPDRASLRATLALTSQIGFARSMQLAKAPWVAMNVLNPLGVALLRNAVAETFTKAEVVRIRYWNPRADSLKFGEGPYARLHFAPQFVEYMKGFKFVYLNPR